jgi:hypothetical protein
MKNMPKLKTSPAKAEADINERIVKGEELMAMSMEIEVKEYFEYLNRGYDNWNKYNAHMLKVMFTTKEISDEYWNYIPTINRREPSIYVKIEKVQKKFDEKIGRLKSIRERLKLFSIAPTKHSHRKRVQLSNTTILKMRKLFRNRLDQVQKLHQVLKSSNKIIQLVKKQHLL